MPLISGVNFGFTSFDDKDARPVSVWNKYVLNYLSRKSTFIEFSVDDLPKKFSASTRIPYFEVFEFDRKLLRLHVHVNEVVNIRLDFRDFTKGFTGHLQNVLTILYATSNGYPAIAFMPN